MFQRTLFTISMAALFCGAYVVYALVVTPRLTPEIVDSPAMQRERTPASMRPPENIRIAQKHLGDQPWVEAAKYQMRTDEAFVYFEDWDRVEPGGEVRFKPFAVIWKREGDGPEGVPLTIVSDSALLKFSQPFDVNRPNPGHVVGGALEGEVTIRGADGLDVRGRNFNFSEGALRVWSDSPLSFAFQGSRGRGLGLEMDLIPGPPEHERPGVSGVRTFRLRRDVSLSLVERPKPEKPQPEVVQIDCNGSFEFDLTTYIANFAQNVRLQRPVAGGFHDHLQCDLLNVAFMLVRKPDIEPKPGPAKLGSSDTELQFYKLRAEGKKTLLVSQKSGLRAEMSELTYDAAAKSALLKDGKAVRVLQKGTDLACPEISFTHTEGGKIVSLVCRGAGQMRSLRESPSRAGTLPGEAAMELAFSADWMRELQKYPEGPLEIVDIKGAVQLNQPGEMALQGEHVKLWLRPKTPAPAGDGKSPTATSNEAGRGDTGLKEAPSKDERGVGGDAYDLDRWLAVENVQFATRQLTGKTARLEGTIETAGTPVAWRFEPSGMQPLSQRRGSPPPRGMSTWFRVRTGEPAVALESRQPGEHGMSPFGPIAGRRETVALGYFNVAPQGQPGEKPPAPPKTEPSEPAHLVADSIRLLVHRQGTKTEVDQVWTEGRIVVTQPRAHGDPPSKITGDRMHIQRASGLKQIVSLWGNPAQIRDTNLTVEGKDILFHRAENRVHVKGAGMLEIPVNQTPQGKKSKQAVPLDVWWKEQMTFDGQVAKFYVGVRTEMGESKLRCEEMHVTFNRKVSFGDDRAAGAKPEVEWIACRQGVHVESLEYRENRLEQVQKAEAWQLTIHQPTGDVQAEGPGVITLWRRGTGKRANLSPTATAKANGPQEADRKTWEFLRIAYSGEMQGNLTNRVSEFRNRIRVVYGPVEHPHDEIDLDLLPKDGGWMRSDSLRVTQIASDGTTATGTRPAIPVSSRKVDDRATSQQVYHTELLARGNAELEGRTFHALADSIAFSEATGVYMLRSLGNNKATIFRQTKVGGEVSRADAQRFEFNPSTNTLLSDRIESVDGLR